jgi:hypothetical protein
MGLIRIRGPASGKTFLGSKKVIVLPMIQAEENAFRYALIAEHCIRLQQGQPDLDRIRIPFLKLTEMLAGQDRFCYFLHFSLLEFFS